uniref:Uncharacterized protein n=1 Tax=Trypanosoma congolense (strain IL3000) TaxID=1068625 RepID=G0UPX1_TRYCI|nr:conserved hypothetical protein [Trypanosoma congolense IL3000]
MRRCFLSQLSPSLATVPQSLCGTRVGFSLRIPNRHYRFQTIFRHGKKRVIRREVGGAYLVLARLQSSSATLPGADAPPSSTPLSNRAFYPIDRENFQTVFDSRPVAERAAATSTARLFPGGRVRLKAFVENLPKVSRDDMFGRGLTVEKWLEECALLQLVEGCGGVRYVELTADPKCYADEGDDSSEGCFHGTAEQPPVPQDTKEVVEGDAVSFAECVLGLLSNDVLGRRDDDEPNYKPISEAYSQLLREGARNPARYGAIGSLKFSEFLSLFDTPRGMKLFWVVDGKYICTRLPGEKTHPRFVSPQPQVRGATAMNGYGGWGAASNVPTREDVYEILKYVPVNWGNFGNLNLPPAVKRKHIRISSTLQWFRRQPFYFELRVVAGTTEIRRSIVLHPEAHGLTPEEAHEQLQLRIAKGEANDLVPLNAEGEAVSSMRESQQVATLLKFISRVCPGYFVPPSLLMQRYTKKNLTHWELVSIARNHPAQFEVVQPKYTDTPLLRRRVGADSARWIKDFVEDFERHPEDVRRLIILMGRTCTTWDRPHYVYVRLTEEEKMLLGGFDEMLQVLRRHPAVFRVGKNFVARVDPSDPLSLQEPEPLPDDMTTRVAIREENPYQTPRDLAVVFHYVAPADEPCTAAFFLQCASPAMRAVLPPRIVTVLQLFPDLFVCRETSPGVFLMRKVERGSARRLEGVFDDASGGSLSSASEAGAHDASRPAPTGGTPGGVGDSIDLEAEFAENDFLSREEAIEAVRGLIPTSGVEVSQLLLWASIGVQQAANRYYGGVLKLVEANRSHFRIQETPESRIVFLADV